MARLVPKTAIEAVIASAAVSTNAELRYARSSTPSHERSRTIMTDSPKSATIDRNATTVATSA